MSLHYSDANGGCGLPGVEEITEKKCEKLAERIAGKRTFSEGLNKGRGKMLIFRMAKDGEKVTNRTGSTKRRHGLWIHLKRSCERKVIARRSSGTNL